MDYSLLYDQSLILKQLGFNGYTDYYYDLDDHVRHPMDYLEHDIIPSPSFLQAFVFLLELANQGTEPNGFNIILPKYDLVHTRDNKTDVITTGAIECVSKLISIINNK